MSHGCLVTSARTVPGQRGHIHSTEPDLVAALLGERTIGNRLHYCMKLGFMGAGIGVGAKLMYGRGRFGRV